MHTTRVYIYAIAFIFLAGAGYALLHNSLTTRQPTPLADEKNIEYTIDGKRIKLTHGVSQLPIVPGSSSRLIMRYFGNELRTDLDDDGREDVVFLLTQESGGSGVYFYVVAARNTPNGYIGSDGYLLGDRVAPQTTELSQHPNHKHVVVVNYADRAPGEPMSAMPSMGKSVYLKLDIPTNQWGIVVPDFEGESQRP